MTFDWDIVSLIKQPADFWCQLSKFQRGYYDSDFPSSMFVLCKPPQPHPGSRQVQVSSGQFACGQHEDIAHHLSLSE